MRPIFLPIAAAAALSACAAIPRLGPEPQMRPADSYATTQSFQAAVTAWPEANWWARYGDPQLDALVEEALRDSPSLVQAQARVRRAEALAEQARGATLPTVVGQAEAAERRQSYNMGFPPQFVPKGFNDTGRATLDLNWDLDLWGRNRASLAAATSEAEAARMDALQARLVLTTNLVSAYADLARQFALRGAAEQALANRRATASLAADKVREGVSNQGEARQSQSEASAAAQDLAAADEQLALARNEIAALLGAGPDRGLALTAPTAAASGALGLPANLAVDLVGRRPDVQAARLRAEAAARRTGAVRAGFYPNLNLVAFIGRQALGLDLLRESSSTVGEVNLATTLPIFSAGQLQGAYRASRAEYDAAVAAYDQTLVQALNDVADAAASLRALQVRLIEARGALAAAEDARRIAQLRYRGGLASYTTALLAEDAAINRRRAVADLEARALALDAALARALGGGFRTS